DIVFWLASNYPSADSVTRVRNATRIGFCSFPQLARLFPGSAGKVCDAPGATVFVDFMAETHNMIAVGRRLGGFLIFGRIAGSRTASAARPGYRLRRRI